MPGVKSSRGDRAAATRSRMLDAAYRLFCEQGFRATTMAAIAERAGVAVQTMYFTFHTKDELLQEVHDRTVLGEDRVPPPLQRWYQAAVAEPDVHAAVRLIVAGVATILCRVAPMVPVFHAVAGESAGQVFEQSEHLRQQGMRDLVAVLARKSPLRKGVTRQRASDVMIVLLAPETYRSFVLDRAWTEKIWITWTTSAITHDLFTG